MYVLSSKTIGLVPSYITRLLRPDQPCAWCFTVVVCGNDVWNDQHLPHDYDLQLIVA